MKILITGGSGLIGQALTQSLIERGHDVHWLSRSQRKVEGVTIHQWDVRSKEIDSGAVEGVDAIIHLAGAGIADKAWTESRRCTILNSRVASLRLLKDTCLNQGQSPKVLITASGTGYYGQVTDEKWHVEEEDVHSSFIGEVCLRWEEAAEAFESLGTRVVALRTPLVLSKKGGGFPKMALPVKLGVGAPLGSGKQYVSWIHIDDLIGAYLHALESAEIDGGFNIVADEQPSNRNFMKAIAKVFGRPFFLPNVPEFLLRGILGQRADLLLEGSRISNKKMMAYGFTLNYSKVEEAIESIKA